MLTGVRLKTEDNKKAVQIYPTIPQRG